MFVYYIYFYVFLYTYIYIDISVYLLKLLILKSSNNTCSHFSSNHSLAGCAAKGSAGSSACVSLLLENFDQKEIELHQRHFMAGLGKGHNVYVGIIKHLNAKSGFGIIACSDTREIFGCDAPFLCPQLNRFSVGDTVHFKSLFDPAKGTPQAFDLSMAAQMQTTTLERRALWMSRCA